MNSEKVLTGKCMWKLTRGKRKDQFCNKPLKKGNPNRCVDHFNTTDKKRCEHVGPKTGRQCVRYCEASELHCSTCKRKIINKQDSEADKLEKSLLLPKYEKERQAALIEYKTNSTNIIMNMLNPISCSKYTVHDFTRPDKVLQNGKTFVGRCCKITDDMGKVINIRSDLSTGKTKQLVKWLKTKKDKKILIITCKITLANDLFSCIDWVCMYNDSKTDISNADKLIIQAESLHRLKKKYDIIIIDEDTSLRDQMFSLTTHKLNISVNHKMLKMQLKNAEKVILLDADISVPTLEFYHELCDFEHIHVYNNAVTKKNKPKVYFHMYDVYLFAEKLFSELKKGKKIVFVTNGKKQGQNILNYLSALFKGENLLMVDNVYYHSKYPFPSHEIEEDGIKRIYTVKDDFVKYDLVMYSPTITQGVNFDIPNYFDALYGYYTNITNNIFQFIQQTARARYLKENEYHLTVNIVINESEYWDKEKREKIPSDEYKYSDISYFKKFYQTRDNIVDEYIKNYLDTNVKLDETKKDYLEYVYDVETDVFKRHFLMTKYENKHSSISGEIGLMELFRKKGHSCEKVFREQAYGCDKSMKELAELSGKSIGLKFEMIGANKSHYKKMNSSLAFRCRDVITSEEYEKYKNKTDKGLLASILEKRTLVEQYDKGACENVKVVENIEYMEKIFDNTSFDNKILFLSELDNYKKRKYQFTTLNNVPNISHALFMSFMEDEYTSSTIIKNLLYEKAIINFRKKYNLNLKQLFSFIIYHNIHNDKYNPNKKTKSALFQRYYLTMRIFEVNGIDIYNGGFTTLDVKKMYKDVILANNKFHKVLDGKEYDSEKISSRTFRDVVEKAIRSWNCYFLTSEKTTIKGEKIKIYKFNAPYSHSGTSQVMKDFMGNVFVDYTEKIETFEEYREKCHSDKLIEDIEYSYTNYLTTFKADNDDGGEDDFDYECVDFTEEQYAEQSVNGY